MLYSTGPWQCGRKCCWRKIISFSWQAEQTKEKAFWFITVRRLVCGIWLHSVWYSGCSLHSLVCYTGKSKFSWCHKYKTTVCSNTKPLVNNRQKPNSDLSWVPLRVQSDTPLTVEEDEKGHLWQRLKIGKPPLFVDPVVYIMNFCCIYLTHFCTRWSVMLII